MKEQEKEVEVIHTGMNTPQYQEQVKAAEEWSDEELGEATEDVALESIGGQGDEDSEYIVDMRKIDPVQFRRLYIQLNTASVGMGFTYELHDPISYTKFGDTEPTTITEVKFSKDVRAQDLPGFAMHEINETLKIGRMAQLISIVCGLPKDAAKQLGIRDITDLGGYVVSFLANGPKRTTPSN